MKFYKIYEKSSKEYVYEDYSTDYESIICPKDDGHQRAGKRITDIRLRLRYLNMPDFMWTQYSDIIITERAAEILKGSGLTGWEVRYAPIITIKPALKSKIDRSNLPRLYHLKATGNGGKAHPDSGIRVVYSCSYCNFVKHSSYKKGIKVDESSWDGTDFFTVIEYSGFVLATSRAKQFLEKIGLAKNITFTPSEELRWPESLIPPEDSYK